MNIKNHLKKAKMLELITPGNIPESELVKDNMGGIGNVRVVGLDYSSITKRSYIQGL